MTRYVVGLLHDGNRVVLIQKTKPEWQKGRWNGPGGKIEPNESAFDAIVREYVEECGLYTTGWRYLARLKSDDVLIYFFTHKVDAITLNQVGTMTEEPVRIFNAYSLPEVIPNLEWLIPLAMHEQNQYEPIMLTEK